ncbi:capsid assembly scaffolding protein Gp46 family protein [Staphylococcus petrasii]|uniref:capsid assembly scaffolding protein Gp46 family protein n=1 Tax=Staphylococcus petrasii TaxID=1276936 RepID=UPI003F6815E1
MNEIKRLKLNLQHFAEDNPNDLEGKDKQSGDNQGDDDKKVFELTQSELDSQKHKAVNKALANQEKKFEQRLKEAVENARSEGESYAKLTQKEREEKALSEREKAIAEREKAQALRELESDVIADLKEQKLPTSFAKALIKIEDNEEIKSTINEIKSDFDAAVKEGIKEVTRQSTPNNQSSSFSRNQSRKEKGLGSIADEVRIIQ